MEGRYFASASRGTEEVLAGELRSLGLAPVEIVRGGAGFGGGLEDAYRACLWSRLASRVLLPLATFEVADAAELYARVRELDWTAHAGPERTLAVDVAGGGSPAGPRHYVALKTKDAIVDALREALGTRPDVDTADPDLRVNVHVHGPRTTVAVDLAGRGLHHRGFGRSGAAAPLKETLAAAILLIAGWPERAREGAPLFDPLCGSATLLVEAAWIALDVAPGLSRRRIGAEGWGGHDAALWQRLLRQALSRREAGRSRELRIAGSDASPGALRAARDNLRRARLGDRVRLERRALEAVEAPWNEPGLLITNPPYGARLGEEGELGPLYERLGDVLRRRFPGWSAWVLTGNPALARRIGLRPASRHRLRNGPIDCRLLELPISATPVTSPAGPGWRRPAPEAAGLATRLRKNLRALEPWARREGLTCYRVYDAGLPEYNLAIDRYGDAVRVEEYERPRKVPAELAERRVRDALLVVAEVLEVDPADVVLRVRPRRGPGEQHQQRDDRGELREVREGPLRLLVNLHDHLDTGLFLDDRLLRRRIAGRAAGARLLNLFAHTCAATVAAGAGGARRTVSIDLSRRALEHGRRTLALNGLTGEAHRLVRADVLRWLERPDERGPFELIFCAPPTWSRSKGMRQEFDVQRHHGALLRRALRLLAPGGELLFSTNRRQFELDRCALAGATAREITAEITPPDFRPRPRLRAWSLSIGG